jgi:hypothetical protein
MDISAEWVATGETGALPEILGTGIEPERARELQGTMAFYFPDLQVENVSIFDTPGVVDWLALLHSRIPHLVYFLDPSRSTGALEGLLLTFLTPDGRAAASHAGGLPVSDEILFALAAHLVKCAVFATDKGDDWEPIVARFIEPLDERARDLLVGSLRDAMH